MSDSNFGENRSRTGALVMLAGAAVLWRVVGQRTPAISPAEAEFYALSTTVAETLTLRQLLEELGHVFASATHVFCDSRAARLLAEHGASSSRTRHIHRRWHFVRYHVDEGEVHLAVQRGAANPANGLTKMTLGKVFLAERAYVMGIRA